MSYRTSEYFLSLPAHMHGAIERYIDNGILPGGFLEAVFANDLTLACMRADYINIQHINDYARFLHWEAPSACHGSTKIVENWYGTIQPSEENDDDDISNT